MNTTIWNNPETQDRASSIYRAYEAAVGKALERFDAAVAPIRARLLAKSITGEQYTRSIMAPWEKCQAEMDEAILIAESGFLALREGREF